MATVPDDVLSAALERAHRWAERKGRTDEEREVARDAATDGVLKALERFDSALGTFDVWAMQHVAMRVGKALSRHRDRVKDRPAVGPISDDMDVAAPEQTSPVDVPMTPGLAELPAYLRDAVRFVHIDGFSEREAELLLGCSRRQLREWLRRAAQLLAGQQQQVRGEGEG